MSLVDGFCWRLLAFRSYFDSFLKIKIIYFLEFRRIYCLSSRLLLINFDWKINENIILLEIDDFSLKT